MKVLVTGSREWRDPLWLFAVLDSLRSFAELADRENGLELIVGDCESGADLDVRTWAALTHGVKEPEVFEADWREHGRAAGPYRNKRMVDEGKPSICLAFFAKGAGNRGTKHCSDYAASKGVTVYRFES
jgi:hypothetical protein